MPTFSDHRILTLPLVLMAGLLAFLCLNGTANAAGMTTATRQQYFESGKYEQDLSVVAKQAQKWINKSANKIQPRLKSCHKRGFKVGIKDPGPDPAADYGVPVTTPPNQMPIAPIYAGPDPGPASSSAAARKKKKHHKGKKKLPKVTKSQCAKTKKPAIAMDMDETATSTYRFGSSTPQYDTTLANANIANGTQTALKPMLQTYKLAVKRGVAVFVITARPDASSLRTITENNLKDVGYTHLRGVYMKPISAIADDTGEVKNSERAEIVRHRGYKLIAMFGDQDSDLVDGFFQRGFKYPDVY